MNTIRLSIGLLLVVGLSGCAQTFWDRSPRVAGRVQPAPYTAPSAPQQAPAPTYAPPGTAPSAAAPAPLPTADTGAEERMVLQHVNQIRCSQGLRPLAFDAQLHAAAREHSQEQCREGYMGHESPDPARRTLVQRMHLAGYRGVMYGEVVAWGYDDAQSVVEGWMNSPEHRAILIDREMTEAAFSRVGQYWTGNFGTPYASPARRLASAPAAPRTRAPVARPTTPPAPSAAAPTYRPRQQRPPVQQFFAPIQPGPARPPTYRPPVQGG